MPAIAAERLTHRYAARRHPGGHPRRAAPRDGGGPGLDGSRPVPGSSRPVADRDRPVLEGVSFQVEPGEVVGILGANGAGKSTLLRVLATLEQPSAGGVRLLGCDAWPPSPALRRRIGYAGETAAHLDALTGRENAVFFARSAGLARTAAEAAVGRLLERLRLADDANKPVGHYSFGMRRKLLLVEALAHSPDVLLLDEPTIGLDPASMLAATDLLRERAEAGAAVAIASHDTAAVRRLCDRVLFLHAGRVVLAGKPAALIAAHGGPHRIEIELGGRAGAAAERLPPLQGVSAVARNGAHLIVEAPAGAAALPGICQALLEAGAGIRSLRVREPGLADVFRAATGAELPDAEPAETPPPAGAVPSAGPSRRSANLAHSIGGGR